MKAELRKKQILECSMEIFSKKGYYETHVEEIIKKAKVGKGTFYRYFKNKENLFHSLLLKFLDDWEDSVFINPSKLRNNNIDDFFRLLIKQSFIFFEQNEYLCNICLRIVPGLSEVFEPFLEKYENRILSYIIRYLKVGMKLGHLRSDLNIEIVSNIIAGAFFRIDYYYFILKKNSKKPVNIDNLADDFINTLIYGISV